jgi:hypothetical protein
MPEFHEIWYESCSETLLEKREFRDIFYCRAKITILAVLSIFLEIFE